MDKVKVKNCLAIAFGIEVDKITDESSQLNLPEWDSLKHLNMIVELELEFDIDFEPSEIGEMKDLETIYHFINLKLK